MNIALLFGVFFLLIMLSVPIGVALGVATSLTICLTSNIGPVMVAQKAFTGLDSFTLIAIPFFMLAGNLMALGGIARRIDQCRVLLGLQLPIPSVTVGIGAVLAVGVGALKVEPAQGACFAHSRLGGTDVSDKFIKAHAVSGCCQKRGGAVAQEKFARLHRIEAGGKVVAAVYVDIDKSGADVRAVGVNALGTVGRRDLAALADRQNSIALGDDHTVKEDSRFQNDLGIFYNFFSHDMHLSSQNIIHNNYTIRAKKCKEEKPLFEK